MQSINDDNALCNWYKKHAELINGSYYCDIVSLARENAAGRIAWSAYSVHVGGKWITVRVMNTFHLLSTIVIAKVGV